MVDKPKRMSQLYSVAHYPKTLYKIWPILVVFLLASGCNKDGDPGPVGSQGDKGDTGTSGKDGQPTFFELGSIKGTVSGINQLNEPFTLDFDYKYGYDSAESIFQDNLDQMRLDISRYEGLEGPECRIGLIIESDDSASVIDPNGFYLSIQKIIETNSVLNITAKPAQISTDAFVRAMGLEENTNYGFMPFDAFGTFSYNSSFNSNPVFVCVAEYQGPFYQLYYDQATGRLAAVDDFMGGIFTSGDVFDFYDEVSLVYDAVAGKPVFFNTANGDPLSENVPAVPADAVTIRNYNRDANSGVITFDFTIFVSGTISTTNRQNTTGHDLTVTGSFNSGNRVYKYEAGRRGA